MPVRSTLAALILVSIFSTPAFSQSLDNNQGPIEMDDNPPAVEQPRVQTVTPRGSSQPKVGRGAAQKYMAPRQSAPAEDNYVSSSGERMVSSTDSHYLALHIGGYISDNAYKWGRPENQKDVGRWNLGVTYRIGEWINSMDLAVRVDLSSYKLLEARSNKLSFLPVITFPDAGSRFPLYFGAGAGLGIFLNQFGSESSLSFDYQVFGGVRFFEVVGNTGFFVEGGLKNHLFLLSDGQYNGYFASVGTNFTF